MTKSAAKKTDLQIEREKTLQTTSLSVMWNVRSGIKAQREIASFSTQKKKTGNCPTLDHRSLSTQSVMVKLDSSSFATLTLLKSPLTLLKSHSPTSGPGVKGNLLIYDKKVFLKNCEGLLFCYFRSCLLRSFIHSFIQEQQEQQKVRRRRLLLSSW